MQVPAGVEIQPSALSGVPSGTARPSRLAVAETAGARLERPVTVERPQSVDVVAFVGREPGRSCGVQCGPSPGSANVKQPLRKRRRWACPFFRRGVEHDNRRAERHELGQTKPGSADGQISVEQPEAHAAGAVAPRQIGRTHGPRLVVKAAQYGQAARSSKRLVHGSDNHVGTLRPSGCTRRIACHDLHRLNGFGTARIGCKAHVKPFLQQMESSDAGVEV